MTAADRHEADLSRSDEDLLKALIRKDIDPEITRLAERALRHTQTGHVSDGGDSS